MGLVTQLKGSVSCPKGNYENKIGLLKTCNLLEFLYKAATGIQGQEGNSFPERVERQGNTHRRIPSSAQTPWVRTVPLRQPLGAEKKGREQYFPQAWAGMGGEI